MPRAAAAKAGTSASPRASADITSGLASSAQRAGAAAPDDDDEGGGVDSAAGGALALR